MSSNSHTDYLGASKYQSILGNCTFGRYVKFSTRAGPKRISPCLGDLRVLRLEDASTESHRHRANTSAPVKIKRTWNHRIVGPLRSLRPLNSSGQLRRIRANSPCGVLTKTR
ncbi:hypothetical protein RSAG8_10100, partial [Rhizoctonia solani AG-8 WAC10335]